MTPDVSEVCLSPRLSGLPVLLQGRTAGLAEEALVSRVLQKPYSVGTDALNRTSAYMSAEEASADEAALWYFANYQEDWRGWLPDDVEAKVEAALIEAGVEL